MGTPVSGGAPPAFVPLRIAARGMCCSLGFHAAAATAAIQARVNHFRATPFVAGGGAPIVGAPLHDTPVWGAERMALMVRQVVTQCLGEPVANGHAGVAVMILCAEPGRPGMPREHLLETLRQLHTDWRLHPDCSVRAYGKAGIAEALQRVAQLQRPGRGDGPRQVLLVGADSLLDAATIEAFLAQERIAGTDEQTDGFIPGEGAGAVLLTREPADEPAPWIDAAAGAVDPWRWGGEQPMRAEGLTRAIRHAAAMAGTRVADLEFHASGMTGEAWYAREVSLALSRCMESKRAQFRHHMVAQFLGETGAASPVLTLAWLADVMGRPRGGPGRRGLLHFAGDDGQRSALVLNHRGAAAPA